MMMKMMMMMIKQKAKEIVLVIFVLCGQGAVYIHIVSAIERLNVFVLYYYNTGCYTTVIQYYMKLNIIAVKHFDILIKNGRILIFLPNSNTQSLTSDRIRILLDRILVIGHRNKMKS